MKRFKLNANQEIAGMQESETGEYVRYIDMQELMEVIRSIITLTHPELSNEPVTELSIKQYQILRSLESK